MTYWPEQSRHCCIVPVIFYHNLIEPYCIVRVLVNLYVFSMHCRFLKAVFSKRVLRAPVGLLDLLCTPVIRQLSFCMPVNQCTKVTAWIVRVSLFPTQMLANKSIIQNTPTRLLGQTCAILSRRSKLQYFTIHAWLRDQLTRSAWRA